MKIFLFISCLLCSFVTIGQNIIDVKKLKPQEEYDNILIKKLDTDSNATSFVIWVKRGVKSHKHVNHSEVLYVIEGEGEMTIGKAINPIKAGDYFRIPKNTYHALKVTSKMPMKVISVQAPEFYGKDRVFEEQ